MTEEELGVLKRCAASANNAAWDLLEDPGSDPARTLQSAAAAREIWGRIGTRYQIAHADLLLAWAAARAGAPETSVALAGSALEILAADSGTAFDKAIAHAAMAAALYASGDMRGFADQKAQALIAAERLEAADRKYFERPFRTLPET